MPTAIIVGSVLCILGGFVVLIGYIVYKAITTQKKHTEVMGTIAERRKATNINGNNMTVDEGSYKMTVTQVSGKHAHFTIRGSVPGDDRYPASFTPLTQSDRTRARPLLSKYPPAIDFINEKFHHKLGKFIRINREFQTGDVEFDRKVYINTDAPAEIVTAVTGNIPARRAILSLLKAGYRQVSVFERGALVRATVQHPMKEAGTPAFDHHTRCVADIMDNLPPVQVELPDKGATSRPMKMALASIVWAFVMLFVTMLTLDWWDTFELTPYTHGGWGALALLGLSLPVLIAVMRGFSNSFVSLLIFMASMSFGAPTTGIFLAKSVNALADFGPTRVVDAKVTNRWYSKSKNSTNYYVRLDPGPRVGPDGKFRISSDLYYDLSQGDVISVTVGDGAFGWVWVDEIHNKRLKKSKRR